MSRVAAALALLLPAVAAAGDIPAIPDARLPDLAMATVDGWGNPLIVYNPALLGIAGPAAGRFFLAHEEAHHALGHVAVGAYADAAMRRQLELEADCAAARWLAANGDAAAVIAGAQALEAQGWTAADALHPAGALRAERIAWCAGA